MRNRWLGRQGDPGWKVARFEASVTLAIFASPTRDKLVRFGSVSRDNFFHINAR